MQKTAFCNAIDGILNFDLKMDDWQLRLAFPADGLKCNIRLAADGGRGGGRTCSGYAVAAGRKKTFYGAKVARTA